MIVSSLAPANPHLSHVLAQMFTAVFPARSGKGNEIVL